MAVQASYIYAMSWKEGYKGIVPHRSECCSISLFELVPSFSVTGYSFNETCLHQIREKF